MAIALKTIDDMRAIDPADQRIFRTYRWLVNRLREIEAGHVHTHSKKQAGFIGRKAAHAAKVGQSHSHDSDGPGVTASTNRAVNQVYKMLAYTVAPNTRQIVCVADAMPLNPRRRSGGAGEQYVTVYSG